MKRRLSIINLTLEINLPTFRLNSPVVIRVKLLEHPVEMSFSELKLVTDNLLFIYSATNWKATEAFGRWKYNQLFLHLFSNILPLATLGKLATLEMFRLFMLKIGFFSTGLIFEDGPIYKRLWYMSGFQKPFCSHCSISFAQHAKTIGEFGKAVDIPSLPEYRFHFYTSPCCQDIKLKHRGCGLVSRLMPTPSWIL